MPFVPPWSIKVTDDAGRRVPRFCSFISITPSSSDPGTRELWRRIASHSEVSSAYWVVTVALALALILAVAIPMGVIVNALGSSRYPWFRDLDLRIGMTSGVIAGIAFVIARILRHDAGRTHAVLQTCEAEGRCGSCGERLPPRQTPFKRVTCPTCTAQWNYGGTQSVEGEGDFKSDDDALIATVADTRGRIYRLVDMESLQSTPEIERTLGIIRDRTRNTRWLWNALAGLAVLYLLIAIPTGILLGGASRPWYQSAIPLLLMGFALYQNRRVLGKKLHETPPRLIKRELASTLLSHEYCPACLATLQVSEVYPDLEYRRCPGCEGRWPLPKEMARFGFRAMTPDVCQACGYALSRLPQDPDGIVLCPECGARGRSSRV